eukprot:TRINITY_DN1734_c0_g1_i1.p1 TRINITY_DN1734_c0_g1~~TRINITY_DN1734_c0_g1_i1.p1  ORF type:complete len:337 (+),score=107.29 TRINITY_DN1734_c0_g1_i1:33-1043(+)
MDREEHFDVVGNEEEFSNIHKITTAVSPVSTEKQKDDQEQERILIKTPSQLNNLKRRKKPKEDKYSIALSLIFNENEYTTTYIPLSSLFPAQCRYSCQNVGEKIQKIVSRRGAVWTTDRDNIRGKWIGKWKRGASVYPPVKSFPVIKSKWGYVLIDGHHHVLAGIALGSTEFPIKIVDNYSNLDKEEFWKKMESKNYAHLYDLRGKKKDPPNSFSELEDDPNRYFALLLCRKYDQEDVYSKKPEGEGSKFPVWLKIGKDIPFVEFVISDILWKGGVIYDPKYINNVPEKEVEKARTLIANANIDGLKVVKTRTLYKEITNLSKYVEIAEKQLNQKK